MVRAPEINRDGLLWFNTHYPLSLEAVRGKLVILDFWTYCCINCMHILPILRRMEERFGDRLVVIGVHSPKFSAEKDGANIAHAIARYDIHHPIIHDPDFQLWQQYVVRAWPTLVFISPDGYVIGSHSGEPSEDKFGDTIEALIGAYDKDGKIDDRALPFPPPVARKGELAFPGKIKRVPGRKWALADSGHHRILLVSDDGVIERAFGSGKPGFSDGISKACFNMPQGLIADEEAIYVADTGNHAIRRIDLESGRVTTLAGNGMRGHGLPERAQAGGVALASPWDLEITDKRLYFANAGSHQLGLLDLGSDVVQSVAGNRAENIVDGSAMDAQLAQPSGLALDATGQWLYFADSETSAIRRRSLEPSARVETLIGKGLFSFGHINGPCDTARLQHPLGLCRFNDAFLIADTYNNAIRLLDPNKRTVSDFGTDFLCQDPLCLPLSEPAGIAHDGENRVILSDSNNHRLIVYQIESKTTRTWLE